jgi:hypothetical protein
VLVDLEYSIFDVLISNRRIVAVLNDRLVVAVNLGGNHHVDTFSKAHVIETVAKALVTFLKCLGITFSRVLVTSVFSFIGVYNLGFFT